MLLNFKHTDTHSENRLIVKNMGVLIKTTSLAAVLQKSKRQPIRLLHCLMKETFTEDELSCSSVRGKKGIHPGLDNEVIDTILCK